MNEALRLYIGRKIGRGQSRAWVLRSYLSSLLVLLVASALSFVLVFVASMTSAIDSTLQRLGSGSIAVHEEIPENLLAPDATICRTETSGGLLYSEDRSILVYVKGVEEDYLEKNLFSRLHLESVENTTSLKGIRISRIMASRLGVQPGDRLTLMLYDSRVNRVRPVLLFLEGTYSSGYNEFDEKLAYTSIDVTDGPTIYEVRCSDVEENLEALRARGIECESYRTLFRTVYENLEVSRRLLSLIAVLVAVLAGFFSVSVAGEYIERDRREIAGMLLLGVERRSLVKAYRLITIASVGISALMGEALGVLLSFLVSPILSSLDITKYPSLQNYVIDFSVKVPFATLVLLFSAMVLSSYISLRVSLKRSVFSSLASALR
ncbi:MAG: hypothetical protein IJ831_00675 [Spirochaetales bacterium]|nr:hypothetical protein [Spirochaetales bacterium]